MIASSDLLRAVAAGDARQVRSIVAAGHDPNFEVPAQRLQAVIDSTERGPHG